MDKTIERIKNNPFYKPNAKQRALLDNHSEKEEQVISFGVIPHNDIELEKHPTGPKRKPRIDKNK